MIKHIIILGSSYINGKRIALDYTSNYMNYKKVLSDIHRLGKDYSIATHAITAESTSWNDVQNADPFFKNVILVKNEKKFIEYLSKDNYVTTKDVANCVLSYLNNCTQLRLEKLLYFCYADYLCNYNKKLFNDTIYAYKYGPGIESINKIFDKKNDDIREEKPNPEHINNIDKNDILPLKSRILNSEDGLNKLTSIESTINKYKGLNTTTLIALTTKPTTPWSHSVTGDNLNKIINDETIINYHKYEEL